MAVTGTRRVVLEVALFVASQAAAWYTVKWMLDTFNPTSSSSKKLSPNSKQMLALQRLGHLNLELDEYERIIANEIIHPSDIPTHFSDIGGLDSIILSLRESIIYPLLYPNLFTSSSLLGPPKGVLLYGPPGCGKTMLAKALAKESNATFINISASVLTNKWFGESNKLVAGLFSLARKCQPCIIFVDEMDCFLRERGSGGGDHEVMGMMKAEFMMLWDGLLSSEDRILVLGATNRPNDIDQAFLRRMPKRFSVGLPDEGQRGKILGLLLKDTPLAPLSTSSPAFRVLASHTKASASASTSSSTSNTNPDSDSTSTSSTSFHRTQLISILAHASNGMSGSDLKEACRAAAMVPVREGLRERIQSAGLDRVSPDPDLDVGVGVGSMSIGGFVSTEGKGKGGGDMEREMKSFIPRSLKIEDFVTAAQGEGVGGVNVGTGGIMVLAGNLVRMAREMLERLEREGEGLELGLEELAVD